MKAANRRLLLSIGALVLAFALTLSTTLAWFSVSSRPNVNGINLGIRTQDDLLVGAVYNPDPESDTAAPRYLKDLDMNLDETEYRLQPLTPQMDEFGLTGELITDDGEVAVPVYYDGNAKTPDETAKGSYLSFDLFFASKLNYEVRLNTGATTVFSNDTGDEEAAAEDSSKNLTELSTWRTFAADEMYYGSPLVAAVGNSLLVGDIVAPKAERATRIGFTPIDLYDGKDVETSNFKADSTRPTDVGRIIYRHHTGEGFSHPRFGLENMPHNEYKVGTGFTEDNNKGYFHAAHDNYINAYAADRISPTYIKEGMQPGGSTYKVDDATTLSSSFSNYGYQAEPAEMPQLSNTYQLNDNYGFVATIKTGYVDVGGVRQTTCGNYYVKYWETATYLDVLLGKDVYVSNAELVEKDDDLVGFTDLEIFAPDNDGVEYLDSAELADPTGGVFYYVVDYRLAEVEDWEIAVGSVDGIDFYSKLASTYSFVNQSKFQHFNLTTDYAELNEFFVKQEGMVLVQLVKNPDPTSVWFEGKMNIKIWLEGTDPDCFEAILKSVIVANLRFTGSIVYDVQP